MKKIFAITGSPALKKAFAEEIGIKVDFYPPSDYVVFNGTFAVGESAISTSIPTFKLPEQWNEATAFAQETIWKEGMWITCKKNGIVRRIANLGQDIESYDDDGKFIGLYPEDYRPANNQEIKSHLLKEAGKKGIYEGLPLCRLNTTNMKREKNTHWAESFLHAESIYHPTRDILSCYGVIIYEKGKWVPVIIPSKKIAGMNFEKRDDKLYTDDYSITKNQIEVFEKMMELFFDYPAYCIEEIKIGSRIFTKKDIKTILEFYYGKNQ